MNDFIIPMMNDFVLHNCGKVPLLFIGQIHSEGYVNNGIKKVMME